MTDQAPDANAQTAEPKRGVGVLLGVGIFFLPIVFSWFTLRKGHSVLSRVVALGWLGFFFVAAAGGAGDKSGPAGGSTPTTAAGEPAPQAAPVKPIEVSAIKLWKDYDANEVAADVKYKGKLLLVRGKLASIDKDFSGDVILKLRGPSQFRDARAELQEHEQAKAAHLKKGQTVTVQCEGRGKIVGSPVLDDCLLK